MHTITKTFQKLQTFNILDPHNYIIKSNFSSYNKI